MHAARDVVTGKIAFITISENQTADDVLVRLKMLPKSAQYINTDHGTNYLSKKVQEYFKENNIQHSMGVPGKSWYNRWIEDFWKRIKYEWFTTYPTNNLSTGYVIQLINKYVDFFNSKRISIYTGYKRPRSSN